MVKLGCPQGTRDRFTGHNQAQLQHNKTYSTFLGRGWNFDNV